MSTIEKALAKQKNGQKESVKKESLTQSSLSETEQVTIAASQTSETEKIQSPEQNEALPTDTMSDVGDLLKTDSKGELNDSHTFHLNNDLLLAQGFIVGGHEKSYRIKEEFRQIKRKLLNNAFGPAASTLKNGNLVMISSSIPNEGKTYVSINLALSIALEQDKTVLLIDADVLKPSLNHTLELPKSAGLVDYLLSEVDEVRDIIFNTDIPNLKIIPAGKQHYLTNELLASDRMASLAKELAERYPDRIVLFDCPPLLGVTETPILASLMGQALVVVEESKSKLSQVKTATSLLHEDMAVGLVMNKAIQSQKDGYGYYGYGYGYGKKNKKS